MTIEAESTAGAYAQQPDKRPFSTMSIIGFVLAFMIPLAGIVVSIIALVQSRKTGDRKGFAVAGVIVSVFGLLFIIACLAVLLPFAFHLIGTCAELGQGVHQIGAATYTCGMTGSSVVYR